MAKSAAAFCVWALVAGVAMAPASAVAVEKGGTVVAVTQTTWAAGVAGDRDLSADAPVFMGDVIRTGRTGEAQIRLIDDTRLVVGPNSYMSIDAFVIERGTSASKVSLSAVRGAFRFFTGGSRKDAYEIKTPTATIGVRGTQFDFSINARGQMALALLEGEAQICDRLRRCVQVSGACSVTLSQRFREPRELGATVERGKLLASAFPFIASQKRLRPGFRADTSACDIQPVNLPVNGQTRAAATDFGSPGSGSGGSFSSFGGGATSFSGSSGQGNNGFGNGGEGAEGATETGNPGGGGGGNGNGH